MGGESLFFDYNGALPGGTDELALCFDWCQRDLKEPLLVVGTSDGELSLFRDSDEGGRSEKDIKRRDKSTNQPIAPTCLEWGPAPMDNLLVTGWHDGALSLWEERDDKASMLREDKMVHRESLCLVKWSPNASRIVSADATGLVGVWKLASQGWLQTLCKITVAQSAVTHLVFRTNDQRPGATGLEAPAFFFATDDGGVYFSGDDGMLSPLAAEASCPIPTPHRSPPRRRLEPAEPPGRECTPRVCAACRFPGDVCCPPAPCAPSAPLGSP